MNNKAITNGVNVMGFIKKSLLLAAALGMAACADDVVDIDRTQPDKVEKSVFAGEWYFRPSVIEVDFNQGMAFEGLEGELERIRWEIRLGELVAYRSYTLLMGAEEGTGEPEFQGSPVAVFPITSHFDVRRQYNAATGEQTNVVVEDMVSRPWYERDFIRVDWSVNLLGNPYKLEEFFSAYSAGAWFERDHEIDNPHRPEVTASNINIVGNYQMHSDWMSCWAMYNDPVFCGENAVKMKLSFKKIEGERVSPDGLNTIADYEPLYYPDVAPIRFEDGTPVTTCYTDGSCERDYLEVFERFGYFRHERIAYDPEFQWTRDGRLFIGHRWNIWLRTYNAAGQLIAPEHRQTGKVIYYTNVQFPDDGETEWTGWQDGQAVTTIWDSSAQLVNEWDMAFRETVAELKRVADPNIQATDIPVIFELHRNDCNVDNVNRFASLHGYADDLATHVGSLNKNNLERACAVLESLSNGGFTWQKLGDLRWSFFNWVDTPQVAGPLGYGPSAADPVTGEIISANANIYGAAVDEYASYAADVVALMNGDIQLEDVVSGENIRDHIRSTRDRWDRNFSRERMDEMNREMRQSRHEWFGGRVPEANRAFHDRKMYRGRQMSMDELGMVQALPVQTSKLGAIVGTPIERELLVNDDMKRAMLGPAQWQPGQPLQGDLQDFSPIAFMLGEEARERHQVKMEFARQSIDMMEPEMFTDGGMAHLADELSNLGWRELYDWMRREIYRSVMAHEVGHTLGLRHNFQGSFDALNYNPKFWESYDPAQRQVVRRNQDGSPTSAERYMYSSIMDYDARFYADSVHGIGAYDKAAIKFGYGSLIETFASNPALAFEDLMWLQDYHNYPLLFTGDLACNTEENCDPGLIEAFDHRATAEAADEAAETARLDGDLVVWAQKTQEAGLAWENYSRLINTYFRDGLEANVTPAQCTGGTGGNDYCGIWNRSYIKLQDLQDLWTTYYETGAYRIPDVVPYKFCSDEIAGWSWVECQPYDKGATYREVTQDRMQRYDAYYFFTNFKRDRVSFNDYDYVNSYLMRLYDRYFSQMSNVYRNYLYSFSNMGRDTSGKELTLADYPVGRDWQAAGVEGLNFLTTIAEQPEPGQYCLDNATQIYEPLRSGTVCSTTQIEVPLGIGKHYYTNWTDEYFYKATRLGTFWDKYAAVFALTDNEGFFFRDFSSYFDVGAFQLSYWSGNLKDHVLDMFTGVMEGGTGKYAWRYDASQTGLNKFVPAPVVDLYDSAEPFDYNDTAQYKKIRSASSYTLQWYGVVLPMARFNSGFDYSADYSNYTKVCLEGYVDCQNFADVTGDLVVDGADFAAYTDPTTGYRYMASRTDKPGRSVSAKLLDSASTYVSTVYNPARAAHLANPTNQELRTQFELAEREVSRRTAFIETLRDFSTYFSGAWR